MVLLFSSFYKRHAMQLRFGMMSSVISLAGAFSGFLAFAIQHLDDKHGIAGWRWIFIIVRVRFIWCILHIIDTFTQEGVATIACGLLAWYLIPTSPRAIKVLTEDEREAYCRDLADDWSGDADIDGSFKEEFSWNEVASAFIDAPHVLMLLVPSFLVGLLVSYDLSPHSLAQIIMSMYRVFDSFMVLLTCIDSRLLPNWVHGLIVMP